jgi:hypothetical protein
MQKVKNISMDALIVQLSKIKSSGGTVLSSGLDEAKKQFKTLLN